MKEISTHPGSVPIATEPSQPASPARDHSYGQILKSSAWIGGSSAINVGIGIVRTKAIALFLGPAGFGLWSIYNSIVDVAQSVASMGINNSGVRQVAEAAGAGDTHRMARTIMVLRRTSLFVGALGALLLVIFSRQLSVLTFSKPDYAPAIMLLSLVVFFRSVAVGQGALLQGVRRIADLAKVSVLGALYGTIITVALVYFLREKGIVPSLICMSAMLVVVSWWYVRRIEFLKGSLTLREVWEEASTLLKLGLAFMASALLTMGAAYVIRLIVLRHSGYDAAGLYQAAWVVGGLYVGFILQAMGSDFFPRLTGAAKDNAECNRLVNEQAHVSLLLAGPGVIATLTFAPLVITAFYSTKFSGAVEALRWICMGMLLRIVAWPMGYIVLAKNLQKIFIWTEIIATAVHIGLAWLLTLRFGVAGATMAFFGLYVWHGFLIYFVVRRVTGFRWSDANRRTNLLLLPLIGLVFCCFYLLPSWIATVVGSALTAVCCVYSLRSLVKLFSSDRLPSSVRRLLTLVPFVLPREGKGRAA